MKKLALLLALLLAAPSALGQSVGASQIKKKTNAGLVADSANALAVGIYRGATAPASPVTGQLWFDTTTTPATPRAWSGSAWDVMPMGGAVVVASLADLPASPGDGRLAWVTSMLRSVIYDGSSDAWYYLDGRAAKAAGTYSLEVAGFPASFLPAAGATSGSVAAGGSVTDGTHVCAVTYYNADGGETMPGATTSTLTAASPNSTLSLSFAASVTGSAGKRIWCSRANTANPLFLVASIDDTSTAVYSVTVADSSFSPSTAPDVDFSAPLPSGWTVQRPGPDYGGCGSTGLSILCAAYRSPGYTATSASVRLTYAIDPGTLEWRTRMRVVRSAPGFSGSTAAITRSFAHGFYAAESNSVAAPNSNGLGVQNDSDTNGLPYGTAGYSPVINSRSAGATWTSSSAVPSVPYPVSPAMVPHWVSFACYWDGAKWASRWGAAPSSGTDFAYWAMRNHAWKPQHLGVVVAEAANGLSNVSGAVIAFDFFTVEPF